MQFTHRKISKAEAEIDWSLSALEIEQTIRAFNPFPVCHTHLNGVSMRIWDAEVMEARSNNFQAGQVISSQKTGIDVATGLNIFTNPFPSIAG